MKYDSASPKTRPRIWAVGMSRLGEIFQEILPAFDEQADIRLVSLGFDEAVAEIERAQAGDVDVIVAAGSNGAYLRSRISIPVVLVHVSGSDALQALAHARRMSANVGLVSHGDSLSDFARFAEVFELKIPHFVYWSADEARSAVLDLRDRAVDVVVGPGLVTEIAGRERMASVFLYSRTSVEAALNTALEIARNARIEASRRERLDAVLRHLRDGVVATDMQWRVQALNPMMAGILGIAGQRVQGRTLQDIAPSFNWMMLDGPEAGAVDGRRDTGANENGLMATVESVQSIGARMYAVTRVPVVEQGVQTGFVTTFQETGALQRIDRSLRSKHRPSHLLPRYSIDDLLGDSAAMTGIRDIARRYARSDVTVLISGETGTGKEILAQGIHAASDRHDYPFVALNCGAFPESLLESELFGYEEGAFTGARRGGKTGLFETAHRGTLFLDEIAEMPLSLQSRLLRVLQEREVLRIGAVEPTSIDVRVIAATHQSLLECVANKTFRQDLLYRLDILQIRLPPLRERPEDILPLASALFARTAQRHRGMAHAGNQATDLDRFADWMIAHDWPGNVRELENFIERIVVWPSTQANSLPDSPARISMKEANRREETGRIRKMLIEANGDQKAVCEALGISRSTLWRKLNREKR